MRKVVAKLHAARLRLYAIAELLQHHILEVGAARRYRALPPSSDWFRSRVLARLFAAAGGLHGHAN
jgi:hypothetical protein